MHSPWTSGSARKAWNVGGSRVEEMNGEKGENTQTSKQYFQQ